MRIMKILGLLAVMAVAISVADPALANCNPGKQVGTFGNGAYAYWHPPAAADTNALTGRFWQQGSRALANEGTCAGFLYFSAAGINMNQFLGSDCVAGCPATRMLTVAQVPSSDGRTSYFLAATVDEVSGPAVDFAYESLGDLNMVEIPRPVVVSSSRAAPLVNLTVNVPAVQAGLYGPGATTAVTGYRILSGTGVTDPGRNAAAYPAIEATATSAGGPANGVTIDVDCTSTATDRWVVTQLQFDGGVVSDLVSQAVQVKCNPALADPRFKLVDKKPGGKNLSPRD